MGFLQLRNLYLGDKQMNSSMCIVGQNGASALRTMPNVLWRHREGRDLGSQQSYRVAP